MKKISSLLCGVMLFALLAALPVLPVSADDPGKWTDGRNVGAITWFYDLNNGGTPVDYSGYTTFTITSAAQLASVADLVNNGYMKKDDPEKTYPDFSGKILKIEDSIDLSDHYWEPIGTPEHPFKGTIQGGTDVEITGLTISSDSAVTVGTSKYFGLVGYGQGATVTQLAISGTINAGETNENTIIYVGAAFGYAGKNDTKDSEVSKITSNVAITVGAYAITAKVGGLVGESAGAKVSGAVNNGTITVSGNGTVAFGGLVGEVSGNTTIAGNIESGACRNNAAINVTAETADVGGIVGRVSGVTLYMTEDSNGTAASAKYVWSLGNLTVTTDTTADVGGFIGSISGTGICDLNGAVFIRKIEVSGNGAANVGGILGMQSGNAQSTLTNCEFTTGITVTGEQNTPLVDEHANTTNPALITVTSTGTVYTGGIYGKAEKLKVKTPTVGDETLRLDDPHIRIESSGYVGGIGGNSKAGDVYTDGLVTITSMSVWGRTQAGLSVGGVFGTVDGLANFQLKAGNLRVDSNQNNSSVGGIVGTASKGTADGRTIYVAGTISVSGDGDNCNIGGFAGTNSGTLQNISMGDKLTVTASGGSGSFMGGFVGKNASGGSINFCYSVAELDSKSLAKNLTLGGLVGTNAGSVSNCYRDMDIKVTRLGTSENSYIGGLIGSNSGTVQTCFVSSNITGTVSNSAVGGLIGQMTGGTVQNCYTADKTVTGGTGSSLAGGFVGDYDAGTIQYCYSAMTVAGGSARGGFFGDFSGIDSQVARCFYLKEQGGVNSGLNDAGTGTASLAQLAYLKSISRDALKSFTFDSGDASGWSTNVWRYSYTGGAYPYPQLIRSSGGGIAVNYDILWYTKDTTANTFAISDEADLAGLAMLVNGKIEGIGAVNFADKTVTVANAIDLQSAQWIPVGTSDHAFAGTFDGGSKLISGLRVRSVSPDTVTDGGLFGHTSGTLTNVYLETLGVTATTNAGALVAVNAGTLTAPDVILSGNITAATTAGGVAGTSSAGISNPAVTAKGDSITISATGTNGCAGGIVGQQTAGGTVTGLSLTLDAAVTAGGSAGGVVGKSAGTISGTTVTVKKPITGTYAGGIVGDNSAAIAIPTINLNAAVSGTGHAGGIAGKSTADITVLTKLTVNGIVSADGSGSYAGGVSGESAGAITVTNLALNANITGGTYAGGVVGKSTAEISNVKISSFTGTVSATDATSCAGGIVGQSTGAITSPVITALSGDVTAGISGYAGGIVGQQTVASISDPKINALTATISAGSYAGGIVGQTTVAISGAEIAGFSGTVSATGSTGYAGGVVGQTDVVISGAEIAGFTGTISATGAGSYAGGIVGSAAAVSSSTVTGTGIVSGTAYAGGLVGKLQNDGTVSGSTVKNTTITGGSSVGGAVGEVTGTLTNDTPNIQTITVEGVTVTGTGAGVQIGGVIGHANGIMAADLSVKNLTLTATATGSDAIYAGGVAGLSDGSILRDSSADTLNVTANAGTAADVYAGGVAGKIAVSSNENATYTLNSTDKLGVYQGVTNVAVTGLTLSVTGANNEVGTKTAYVGGAVGQADKGVVYDSNVSGTLNADGFSLIYAGGAVGQTGGAYLVNNTVDCGQALSDANTYYAGGFAGQLANATARFNHVTATANKVTVSNAGGTGSYAGGFVGETNNTSGGTVSENAAAQAVSVTTSGGNSYAGGFAGKISSTAEVKTCYATGNVTVNGTANSYAGGFVGDLSTGTVDSCYASGNTVSATAYNVWSGGFAGQIENGGTVSNCYAVDGNISAVGDSSGSALAGGFSGVQHGTVNDSYADASFVKTKVGDSAETSEITTVVFPAQSVSLTSGSHLTDFDFDTTAVWCYLSGKNQNRPVLTTLEGWDTWPDFAMLRNHGLSDLSVGSAAQFGTAARLLNDSSFRQLLTNGRSDSLSNVTLGLTADISLSGKFWNPIQTLRSGDVLDGQSHTVSGLAANAASYANYGLVKTNSGTVQNLTISGANVIAGAPAGLVAGENTGSITNVTVSNSTLTGSGTAGAVAGTNSGTMSNITVNSNVTVSGTDAGGIAGSSNGSVSSATSHAHVIGTVSAGGAVGTNTGTLTGITASSNANVSGSTAGGITGTNGNSGKVYSATSQAEVHGTVSGGVVGSNAGEIGTGPNVGNVTSNAMVYGITVGGIAGANSGTIQYCDTLSTESMLHHESNTWGGIVPGFATTDFSNCRFGQCAAPSADPASRSFTDKVNVTLSTTTDGATIYYTTNGADPTTLSTPYTADFEISDTTTIKAIAVKAGMFDSSVFSVTYTKQSTGGSGGAAPASKPAVTVPVSGDKTTLRVSVTVSDDNVTLSDITGADLQTMGTGADIVIDLTGLDDAVNRVTVSGATLETITAAAPAGLKIELTDGAVELDKASLAAVASQVKESDIQLVVIKGNDAQKSMTAAQKKTAGELSGAVVLDVHIAAGNTYISDLKGGMANITVPYSLGNNQLSRGVVVWYVAENGEKSEVPSTYNGTEVMFTVEHFSHYVIAYNAERAVACARDETCPISSFTDADPVEWYHDGVHFVLESGIMSGYGGGMFGPNDTTSRAMIAQILYNMEGKPAIQSGVSFDDVAENVWYAMAISWAESKGIINGYGNGLFCPEDAVTREQLAAIVYRYAQYKGVDVSASSDLTGYTDVDQVSDWALPSMRWMVATATMLGRTTTTLNANDNATRAEIATIVMRYAMLDK